MPDVSPGLQRRKKTIDGFEYEVTTLDAYASLPVFDRVTKVILPVFDELSRSGVAIGALAAAGASPEELAGGDTALFIRLATRALSLAAQRFNAADMRLCIDAFANATTIAVDATHNPPLARVFAAHFAGRQAAMWQWFYFCLEVNFADFLDVARATMKRAAQQSSAKQDAKAASDAATPPSASPAAPTGGSGGS